MTMQRLNPGPIDGSVLTLQHQHRSSAIWNKIDRGILNCRRRGALRKSMCNPDERIKEHLVTSGFYGLHLIQFIKLDHALITALAERWRQETHTFHLPVGEATVTLQDVAVLLGLPVDGLPIVSTGVETMTAVSMCESFLGSTPPQDCIKGYCVKLAWLTQTFASLPENADDTVVKCYSRAYILLLMAGALFSDRTQNWVNLRYLAFLKDLKKAGEYSWGSAALALLYRELCRATSPEVTDICGPLILLQLWAWERFPHMRPTRRSDPPSTPEGFPKGPHGYRWCAELSTRNVSTNVLWVYRNQLDQQKENQMIWEPYDAEVMRELPDYCLTGSHIWRSKCPLIYYGIVELHFPDRVLRQFGLRQKVPSPCDTLLSLHDIDRVGKAHVNWVEQHREWITMWEKRHELVIEGKPSKGPMKKDDPYMLWYNHITRRFIGPLDDSSLQRYQEHGARYASMGQVLQNILDQAKYASSVDNVPTYRHLCQYIMTVGELEMNRYHGIQSHQDECDEASAQPLTLSRNSNANKNGVVDARDSGKSITASSQATASHVSTSPSDASQVSSSQSDSGETDSGHSSSNQPDSCSPSDHQGTNQQPIRSRPRHSQIAFSQSLPILPVISHTDATTACKSICTWPTSGWSSTSQLVFNPCATVQSASSWPVTSQATTRKAKKSLVAANKAVISLLAAEKPTADEPAGDEPMTKNHFTDQSASEHVAISLAIGKQTGTDQTGARTTPTAMAKTKRASKTRGTPKRAGTSNQAKAKKSASIGTAGQPTNSEVPPSYHFPFTGSVPYSMPFHVSPMMPIPMPITSGASSSTMPPLYWPYPIHPSMYHPHFPPTPPQFISAGNGKFLQTLDNALEASTRKKRRKEKALDASKRKKHHKSSSQRSKKVHQEHTKVGSNG